MRIKATILFIFFAQHALADSNSCLKPGLYKKSPEINYRIQEIKKFEALIKKIQAENIKGGNARDCYSCGSHPEYQDLLNEIISFREPLAAGVLTDNITIGTEVYAALANLNDCSLDKVILVLKNNVDTPTGESAVLTLKAMVSSEHIKDFKSPESAQQKIKAALKLYLKNSLDDRGNEVKNWIRNYLYKDYETAKPKGKCPDFTGVYEFQGADGSTVESFNQNGCKTIKIASEAFYLGDRSWESTQTVSLDGKAQKYKSSKLKKQGEEPLEISARFAGSSLEVKKYWKSTRKWDRTVFTLKANGDIFFRVPDENLPQGDIPYDGVRKKK